MQGEQKRPGCLSADEQILKRRQVRTIEFYSAGKKNEVMNSEGTCMELESDNKGDSERQTPCARPQCGVQLVLFLYVCMCRHMCTQTCVHKCSCEWRHGFDAHVFLNCLLILVNSLVVFLVGWIIVGFFFLPC